jgi:hypothetical protein
MDSYGGFAVLRNALLCLGIGILLGTPQLQAQPNADDVLAVSKRIDELILKRAKEAGIALAGPTDDATFIRRLSLDLIGKIPSLTDSRDYIDNSAADKRWEWVEKYLRDPRFAQHFAVIYRNILLPTSDPLAGNFQPGFESFLNDRFKRDVSYSVLAKEILTSPLGRAATTGDSTAFFAAAEGKPENMATATSRVFLGVKLDCAQCHAHPFASWSKDQFWEFAAFFSTSSGGGRFANKDVKAAVKPFELGIPETQKVVKAKFLDGVQPKAEGEPLNILADWVTSPKNPYFAKAAADHLWSYFFGVGLFEPILEQANDDAVTHPELLDLLANELIDHQFDLKFLIRAIVHTQAYQRTSEGQGHPQELRYFARMPVRGMTAEQFFDSFCEATGYREAQGFRTMNPRQFIRDENAMTPRQQFLFKFTTSERRHETHTSIQQALFLMNGPFAREQTRVESNESLRTLVQSKRESTARKLQTLFLMTVCRLPRPDERERIERYIESRSASGDGGAQAWSDVFWALLNSAEFRLNY